MPSYRLAVRMTLAAEGRETIYFPYVFTSFLPLTFVTGFFGMNFGWMVHHIDSPLAFWLLGLAIPIATAALSWRLLVRRLSVSAIAAAVAAPALAPTKRRCETPAHATCSVERKWRSAGGSTARATPAASTGSRVNCRSIRLRIWGVRRESGVPRPSD